MYLLAKKCLLQFLLNLFFVYPFTDHKIQEQISFYTVTTEMKIELASMATEPAFKFILHSHLQIYCEEAKHPTLVAAVQFYKILCVLMVHKNNAVSDLEAVR